MTNETSMPIHSARLAELLTLEAGWLDGEGEEISDIAVTHAQEILDGLGEAASEFQIFPLTRGGVSLERMSEHSSMQVRIEKDPDHPAPILVDVLVLAEEGAENDYENYRAEHCSTVEEALGHLRAWLGEGM